MDNGVPALYAAMKGNQFEIDIKTLKKSGPDWLEQVFSASKHEIEEEALNRQPCLQGGTCIMNTVLFFLLKVAASYGSLEKALIT